jgi:FlaG protein
MSEFSGDSTLPLAPIMAQHTTPRELMESERVVRAVEYLSRAGLLPGGNRPNPSFEMGIDPATKKNVIKVLDKDTREVIYQIPPAEALRMAANAKRAAREAAKSDQAE